MIAAGVEDARIVPMRGDHIDQLMPYEREMFGSEAWTRSSYQAELADTRSRTYVAAEGADGALLGWAGVRVVSDEAEVLTVGVVPEARRHGLARRLLGALLLAAREQGAADVFLEVRVDNAAAQELYRSEGFEALGVRPGYYDHGRVAAVMMHREL